MAYSRGDEKNNDASTSILAFNSEIYVESEELIIYLTNYLKPTVLNDLQEQVIRSALDGKTYIEISKETHNDPDYLKGVGAKLWQILSEALGEEVTKRNIRLVAKRNYKRLKKFNEKFAQEANNTPKVTNLWQRSQESCKEIVTNYYRDWGDAIDVSFFYGRNSDLAILKRYINYDRCRLVAILGMGGIGKTSLASMLVRQVESEFEIVIWKSLRNAPDFKSILAELIVAVCDRQSLYLADTVDGQINNLMNCLCQKRCLLVFDGLDNVFASDKLCGQYLEHYQGYGQLLRRIQDEQHQSCVVLTSREKPAGLSLREGENSLVRSHLVKNLSVEDGMQIISDRNLIGSASTLKQLIVRCEGNPLVLKMASTAIETVFDRNISVFLDCNLILYGDIWQLIDKQFQRLTPIEKKIIKYIALEVDEPSFDLICDRIKYKMSKPQLIEGLESLQKRSLIMIQGNQFILPAILIEYIQGLDLS